MSESDEDHQPSDQDQEVAGSEDAAMEVEEQEHHPQINEHLSVLREQNDNRCATYVFSNQDHTLGNVLRTVLSGHHDVQFVGYSIPHPSETKMNLRLQTLKMDSNFVLNEALAVVQEISKTLRQKFIAAMASK